MFSTEHFYFLNKLATYQKILSYLFRKKYRSKYLEYGFQINIFTIYIYYIFLIELPLTKKPHHLFKD